jgi:hypothetical protein
MENLLTEVFINKRLVLQQMGKAVVLPISEIGHIYEL